MQQVRTWAAGLVCQGAAAHLSDQRTLLAAWCLSTHQRMLLSWCESEMQTPEPLIRRLLRNQSSTATSSSASSHDKSKGSESSPESR
jgi:hypothetical protein